MYRYFFIIFFYCSVIIFSQERKDLSFIHYSTEQGLSSNEVSKITQDKLGFIWVGTEDGLNRFDGYSFKVYRKKTHDTTGLCDNFISNLLVDSHGNLWIGTQKGLSLYNRNSDSFINYYLHDNDNTSQSNNVTSLTEDQEGNFYACLEHQIYKFNPGKKTFSEIVKIKSEIRYLYFDTDNLMWVLTDDDIKVFNRYMIQVDTITNSRVKYPYSCMIEDGDKYWISTNGNGMYWYDKRTKTLLRSFQNDVYENYINTIYKDRQNNIWIGCLSSF